MALPFIPSDAGVLLLQAGVVAAPRAPEPRVQQALKRFRGRGWAIIPIASIVGVIYLIRYASQSANWITDLALVAVPLLAAIALGWASRGSKPYLAAVAAGLFVLTWRAPSTLEGQAAGALLDGLSCVTLGVLLGAVTPSGWLKAGIVAMSVADVWLVASDLLQSPNGKLVAAAPGHGLPQLQSESFGTISLGYGDLFVAGLLGAVYSHSRRTQLIAAGLTLAIAVVFDLLFLVVNELPATVPVALALLVVQVGFARGRSGTQRGRWLGRTARERAP
jgi:hypothetical protein